MRENVCVCVCVWERERKKQRGGETKRPINKREREGGREREDDYMTYERGKEKKKIVL